MACPSCPWGSLQPGQSWGGARRSLEAQVGLVLRLRVRGLQRLLGDAGPLLQRDGGPERRVHLRTALCHLKPGMWHVAVFEEKTRPVTSATAPPSCSRAALSRADPVTGWGPMPTPASGQQDVRARRVRVNSSLQGAGGRRRTGGARGAGTEALLCAMGWCEFVSQSRDFSEFIQTPEAQMVKRLP